MGVGDDALLNDVADVVLVVDESGALRSWNRALRNATSLPDSDLESFTLADVFPELSIGTVIDQVRATSSTQDVRFVRDLETATGERTPYEVSVSRTTLANDQPALAFVARDVTSGAAEGGEATGIVHRMSDGFVTYDATWNVTFANERGKDILRQAMGVEDEATVVGRHLWTAAPEIVDTPFDDRFREAMSTQEPVQFEEYYHPLDTWFEIRAYPSESGLSVYFFDVTERVNAREALGDRGRVLREMHDVIADRTRTFDAKVESLLALGRSELGVEYGTLSHISDGEYVFEYVDAGPDDVKPGDVVPLEATNCERVASEAQSLVLANVERDAPEETDGAGFTEWSVSCYIGAPVIVDDDVYGTFCLYDTEPRDEQFKQWEVTLVDLMARWVSYELQRRQTTERLERQNRKLEGFASVVSHDLRNPLNVLEGNLTIARDSGDPSAFDDCEAMIDRMRDLIEDLLSLARAGDGIDELADVHLPVLLEESWATVDHRDATLAVQTDRIVRGDESRVQGLFENLFRNAVEHVGPDVRVTVGDLDDGFYVQDDGPGIPEADRDAVRESGYTTDEDGTGFGLTIVSEIAAAHDWTLEITDAPDGGARFEFRNVAIRE